MEPILQIKNLKKTFSHDLFEKSQQVVKGLTCDFPAGKCTGFMGHNGAGKTTTIKTIFGLLRPDSGQILFRGRDLDLAAKKVIGYMPETNKLPRNLTSYEILMNHLRVFKPAGIPAKQFPDTVRSKLEEVGLWEHRQKRVSKLSKGMGRRLSWSQATIHNPDLVILDEPFSGLDPLGRTMMSKLIAGIRNNNKSIILCTHEIWSVNEVCDELHILRNGELAYSTINPVSGQLPTPIYNYSLKLSGVTKDTITDLGEKASLPPWEALQEDQYLVELGFGDYVDAARWLATATSEGIIVVSFNKHRGFNESELIKSFEGGAI